MEQASYQAKKQLIEELTAFAVSQVQVYYEQHRLQYIANALFNYESAIKAFCQFQCFAPSFIYKAVCGCVTCAFELGQFNKAAEYCDWYTQLNIGKKIKDEFLHRLTEAKAFSEFYGKGLDKLSYPLDKDLQSDADRLLPRSNNDMEKSAFVVWVVTWQDLYKNRQYYRQS